MVDTSAPIASHITKLQQDLKVLIQDQLPLVNYFNMARSAVRVSVCQYY